MKLPPADPRLDTATALSKLTLDWVRPLAVGFGIDSALRKAEIVKLLARELSRPETLRKVWLRLPERDKSLVAAAAHAPHGLLNADQFAAVHGPLPVIQPGGDLTHFFLTEWCIPADLRNPLRAIVPPPSANANRLPTLDEPPTTFQPQKAFGEAKSPEPIAVRVRETATEALSDLHALLLLAESSELKFTSSKRIAPKASRNRIAEVLTRGDFYTKGDQGAAAEIDGDLGIKAFAWPALLAAGELVNGNSDSFTLSAAGTKALAAIERPAPIIKALWNAWRDNHYHDEFARIGGVLSSGASLSPLVHRRKAVIECLANLGVGRWVAIEPFLKTVKGTGMVMSRYTYGLHIGGYASYSLSNYGFSSGYGRKAEMPENFWEATAGRFTLAVLFESAATLGLIDVAYVPPRGAREDYRRFRAAERLPCLSRYDGLLAFRITPLGAYCLGKSKAVPEAEPRPPLRVLPNLDVVTIRPPFAAADRLVLSKYAVPQSDAVWRIDPALLLKRLEAGASAEELPAFLVARCPDGLPAVVQTTLTETARKAARISDNGTVRLFECDESMTAELLAHDRSLAGKVWRAGAKGLIFRHADEAMVRRAMRKLGFVVPPPSGANAPTQ